MADRTKVYWRTKVKTFTNSFFDGGGGMAPSGYATAVTAMIIRCHFATRASNSLRLFISESARLIMDHDSIVIRHFKTVVACMLIFVF